MAVVKFMVHVGVLRRDQHEPHHKFFLLSKTHILYGKPLLYTTSPLQIMFLN